MRKAAGIETALDLYRASRDLPEKVCSPGVCVRLDRDAHPSMRRPGQGVAEPGKALARRGYLIANPNVCHSAVEARGISWSTCRLSGTRRLLLYLSRVRAGELSTNAL
jgi:hypothetical protein